MVEGIPNMEKPIAKNTMFSHEEIIMKVNALYEHLYTAKMTKSNWESFSVLMLILILLTGMYSRNFLKFKK